MRTEIISNFSALLHEQLHQELVEGRESFVSNFIIFLKAALLSRPYCEKMQSSSLPGARAKVDGTGMIHQSCWVQMW